MDSAGFDAVGNGRGEGENKKNENIIKLKFDIYYFKIIFL